MRISRRTSIVIGVVAVLIVACGLAFARTLRYGFSAHDEPTRIEATMAKMMRHYSAPTDLRDAKNPIPLTPAILDEARDHFADHCAGCHDNDGKGQTEMGPRFYPKVPDMTRPETQSQSDGELFATIENGIRLSGMPGWGDGTAESARGSWTLVHFIRHLPKLTPEEIGEMEKANPKSPEEWEAMQNEQKFLEGDSNAKPATPEHHH